MSQMVIMAVLVVATVLLLADGVIVAIREIENCEGSVKGDDAAVDVLATAGKHDSACGGASARGVRVGAATSYVPHG